MTSTLPSENRSRFDHIAAEWDDSPMRASIATAVADAIAAAVPLSSNWRALEYGCGTGLVGVRLLPRLQYLLATDLSPGMLAVLRDKASAGGLDRLTTQVLDLTCMPPPTDRYDFVFTNMAMHHISDVGALIRAFGAMLVLGGWVALADLDAEDGSFHGPDVPGVAHHGFDRAQVQRWLTAVGFTNVTFRTAHTVEKTRDGDTRRYPIFLATAQRAVRRHH